MAKVKKDSKTESISKSPKKSHSAVQSIKSPKLRKKAVETPLKKKNKTEEKTLKLPHVLNPENSKYLLKTKQKESKAKQIKVEQNKNTAESSLFEEKFKIKIEDVKTAIEGAIQLHTQNPKVKNQLFEDEAFPLSILINCHQIPLGHTRILRIPLKHTLNTPDDDICLIVSEVQGVGNKEHDKHIEHYENLLSAKGVTNIKKVMTVHEFKTEYETYEQKRRLADLYDHFLVCAKVGGKIVKKCGKIFYKRRKVPTSVKLQVTNLKEHIDKQLSKAFLFLHNKGDSYSVEFGTSNMESSALVDNFISAISFLDKEFPGNFGNFKGLHIKAPRSSLIPVYVSSVNSNEVAKAKVLNKNKFIQKSVKGELTTQLNAEVVVKPSGKVTVIREKHQKKNKRTREEIENSNLDNDSEVARKKPKFENKHQIANQENEESKPEKKKGKQVDVVEVKAKKLKNKEKIIGKEENILKPKKNKNVETVIGPIGKKKTKIIELEVDNGKTSKSKRQIMKVKHMDNSIIIEDLSTTPSPKKKSKNKEIDASNRPEQMKSLVNAERKKLKNKKSKLLTL